MYIYNSSILMWIVHESVTEIQIWITVFIPRSNDMKHRGLGWITSILPLCWPMEIMFNHFANCGLTQWTVFHGRYFKLILTRLVYSDNISLQIVHGNPTGIKSEWFKGLAWWLTSDKPISETMLILFINVYIYIYMFLYICFTRPRCDITLMLVRKIYSWLFQLIVDIHMRF